MDGKKFLVAGGIAKWAILVKDGRMRADELRDQRNGFAPLLASCARSLGMEMRECCDIMVAGRSQSERDIERELKSLNEKWQGLQIVVVVLPGGGPGSKEAYGKFVQMSLPSDRRIREPCDIVRLSSCRQCEEGVRIPLRCLDSVH